MFEPNTLEAKIAELRELLVSPVSSSISQEIIKQKWQSIFTNYAPSTSPYLLERISLLAEEILRWFRDNFLSACQDRGVALDNIKARFSYLNQLKQEVLSIGLAPVKVSALSQNLVCYSKIKERFKSQQASQIFSSDFIQTAELLLELDALSRETKGRTQELLQRCSEVISRLQSPVSRDLCYDIAEQVCIVVYLLYLDISFYLARGFDIRFTKQEMIQRAEIPAQFKKESCKYTDYLYVAQEIEAALVAIEAKIECQLADLSSRDHQFTFRRWPRKKFSHIVRKLSEVELSAVSQLRQGEEPLLADTLELQKWLIVLNNLLDSRKFYPDDGGQIDKRVAEIWQMVLSLNDRLSDYSTLERLCGWLQRSEVKELWDKVGKKKGESLVFTPAKELPLAVSKLLPSSGKVKSARINDLLRLENQKVEYEGFMNYDFPADVCFVKGDTKINIAGLNAFAQLYPVSLFMQQSYEVYELLKQGERIVIVSNAAQADSAMFVIGVFEHLCIAAHTQCMPAELILNLGDIVAELHCCSVFEIAQMLTNRVLNFIPTKNIVKFFGGYRLRSMLMSWYYLLANNDAALESIARAFSLESSSNSLKLKAIASDIKGFLSLIKDKLEQEYISCFLKVLSGFLSLFSEEQLKIIVGQFSNDEYVNLLDFLYLHKKQREAVVLYNNCPEKMLFNKAIALNILNSRYKDNPEVERFFVIDQGAFDNTAAAYIDSFQKQLASLSRLSEPDRAYYLQQLVHFFQNSSQFIPNICITKHQEIELVAKCALVFFATLEKLDGAPLSNFVKAAQEIYKAILQYSSRYTLHMYETLNKSWQIVQRKVANLPSLIQMACLNGILPDCYWNEFAKTIDDSFKIKILEESSKTIKAILMTIGKSEQAVTRTLLEQVYQDILLYLLLSYKSDLKSGLLNRGSIASLQQNILRLICHFYGFEAGEISAACCDTYNDLMQFLLEKIFQRLLQIDLTVFGFTSEEREKCDLFLEDFIRWHDCLVKIPAIDMMQSLRYREEVLLNDVGILIKYLTALDIKANLVAKNIIDALWQAIIILHRNITSEIDRFNVVEIGNMEEVLQRAKVLHMQKFGFIGRVVPLLLQAHFHKPQKISKIMFPCSFFEDLLSCYKAVCSHKHDLRTITKSERFFFELGRSGNYEEELFESADVIESVRAKIILELRLTSDSWGEEKRFEAGKVKWELYKNYLESLGIKDERFQSYIAAVLVQQNQKIMINDRSIIVNFSFSVSPLAWTALSELIWSVHSLTIMLKGGEKKPCVSYRYDSKEKNVAISYVDNLYLVDGDGGRHLCANVQYGITLYEDMQRLPDFYYRVIWKENVVVDGNNFSDLINVAFDPADIMMFPLQTRRLIVFNRILNDQDGAITLDLLGNQELRNSLMLTDKLFFSELIDLVTRKKGGAEEGKFAETLAILTSLKDLFAKRELRKASKQDSVSYLVTAARNSLLRLSTDSRLPRYWHYNLTQFASSNHPPKEKGKAQLKLAERMQNLQAAVTKLSDPRFQEKMSDADLVHILDTVGADIVSLYLCNCRKVTPEVLRVIKVKCPNIRWIYIVGLDWSNIVGVEFQHLHKLSLSHMPFLSQVRIAAASIKTVEVIDCPKLKILETTEIERAGLDVASSAAADFGYNIIKCPNLVTVLPKLPDRDPSSSVLRNSLRYVGGQTLFNLQGGSSQNFSQPGDGLHSLESFARR